MATITIVITEGPYGRLNANTALRVAIAALEDGHKVNIFLTQDGGWVGTKGLDPKAHGGFLDLATYLGKVIDDEDAEIRVCSYCAELRGLAKENYPEKFEMATAHDLLEWILKSDKVITF